MPKGTFTQTLCVLLKGPVSRNALEETLGKFKIRGRHDAAEEWAFGGPSITVAFRPKVNGYVVVDIVERSWPDGMGNPHRDTMVFGAWGMGGFGPFTYPGGLQRAAQQCWAWEPGKTIADHHTGFIRIRSSYVFGSDEDAQVMPDDYEPATELQFVTEIAVAVLGLPEALCYFNPNGEVLRDLQGVRESLEYARSAKLLPLDLWSNIRLFNLNDDWSLMDTVGNGQLDLSDIEACFSRRYDCGEVDRFLRNVTWYLFQKGEVIKDGDTMDGPGEIRWKARSFEKGLTDPPRHVLSWFPLDGLEPLPAVLER